MSYIDKFTVEFAKLLLSQINNKKEIVFLCIGTDALLGDSFGPLVGYMLKKKKLPGYIHVIGELQNTINIKNVFNISEKIYQTYYNPLVIVIDAALRKRTKGW